MTRTNIRLAGAALATVLMLGGTASSAAQPQAAQQQPPAAQAQQTNEFSDGQVKRFAQSFGEIMKVRERFTAELQQVDDAEEANKLQQKTNDEMVGIIEDNGITVPEYNAIAQAMQSDPELRNRVVSLIQQ